MPFSIRQLPTNPEPFANYEYEIFDDERLVARYWHDFRGDEHGIRFVDGRSEDWPVGRMTDFIVGGGPQPLRLTNAAIAYLTTNVTPQT